MKKSPIGVRHSKTTFSVCWPYARIVNDTSSIDLPCGLRSPTQGPPDSQRGLCTNLYRCLLDETLQDKGEKRHGWQSIKMPCRKSSRFQKSKAGKNQTLAIWEFLQNSYMQNKDNENWDQIHVMRFIGISKFFNIA